MPNIRPAGVWHDVGYWSDLVRELVTREVKIRYKRSVLGVGWSLLNPLLQLAVLAFVFRSVVPVQIEHYPVFLFIGILVWSWFQASVHVGSSVIVDNPMLIRQPGFPSLVLPVMTVVAQLVNFVLALPILFIVLLLSDIP